MSQSKIEKTLQSKKNFLKKKNLKSICVFMQLDQFGVFFSGGQSSNSKPCIYYVLSITTELSSRGQTNSELKSLFIHQKINI